MSNSQERSRMDNDRPDRRGDDRERRRHRSREHGEDRERRHHRSGEDRERRHHRDDRDRRHRDDDGHRPRRHSGERERGSKRTRSTEDRHHDDRSSRRDDDRGRRYEDDDDHRHQSRESNKISSKFGDRVDASSIQVNPYLAYGTAEAPTYPGGIDPAAIAKIMGLSGDGPIPPPPQHITTNNDEEQDHDFNNIHQDSYFNVDAPPTQILTPISIKVGGVKIGLPKNAEKFFIIKHAEDLTEEERGAMVLHQGAGALTTLGDFNLSAIVPMVSGELARVARENRRIHVSGFPRGTTKQELDALFSDWCHILRRKLTVTRMRALGRADDAEKLPADAVFAVDKVMEVFLDETKEKPFSFVEFNNDDICDIFMEHGNGDTIELTLRDGRTYPIKINRPRDYSAIFKTDDFRILIQGIPSQLTERNVRQLVESSDAKIIDFQMKDRLAYVEFEDDQKAEDTLKFLNGLVIRNNVVVCTFLTDVMRAYCVQQGMRICARPDDVTEDILARMEEGDVLHDVLQLQGMLPQTLSRLHRYYPHLKPFMGLQPPVYPTTILVLLNIVDELDLENDDVYSILKANILREAEKYGTVKQLLVPRYEPKPTPPAHFVPAPLVKPTPRDPNRYPGAAQDDEAEMYGYEQDLLAQQDDVAAYEQAKKDFHKNTETWKSHQQHPVYGYGIGKVFIEFEDVKGAEMAQRHLSGRLFCNRTVVTSFLFEDILYPELAAKLDRGEEDEIAEVDEAVEEVSAPAPVAVDDTATTTVTTAEDVD